AGDLRPRDHHHLQAGGGRKRFRSRRPRLGTTGLLRTKAPGIRGLRRVCALDHDLLRDLEARPGGLLARLIANVDPGQALLPAAPAFVEEDAEEADSERQEAEAEADEAAERRSSR